MKKFRFVALGLAVSIALTGCGAAKSGSSTTGGTAREVAPPVEQLDYSTMPDEELNARAAAGESGAIEERDSRQSVTTDGNVEEEPDISGTIAGNTSGNVAIAWQTIESVYEDLDGYKIKKKIKLSPLIASNKVDELTSAINELGGDISDLPTVEYGKTLLKNWQYREVDEAFYVIGEASLENVTPGFGFTSDNTHSATMFVRIEPDEGYEKSAGTEVGLYCSQFENSDNLAWEITKVFFSEPMQVSGNGGHGDSIRFEKSTAGSTSTSSAIMYLGSAKMNSNKWGPVRFVMMFPNKRTPNLPDGFGIYKHMSWGLGDESIRLDIIE